MLRIKNGQETRDISFIGIDKNELDEVFYIIKAGTYSQVSKAFGWDECFQQQRFNSSYQSSWFHWIYYDSTKIGLVCFKLVNSHFHLHYLILFPSFQSKGLGSSAMAHIHKLALSHCCDNVTLNCFKHDEIAVSFYQRMEYEVIDEDEHFFSMRKEIR